MNRCSRVDTFLPLGWSVAFHDGQYRAVWPGGPMARFQLGNEGPTGMGVTSGESSAGVFPRGTRMG